MSTEGWIDTHCHLDAFVGTGDLETVVSRARAEGVTGWIVPGVAPDNWPRVRRVCKHVSGAAFALGIHPWWSHQVDPQGLDALARQVSDAVQAGEPVVAVGECGLDRLRGDARSQEAHLAFQIDLANRFALPVILHCVRRHGRLLEILSRFVPQHGFVVHAFSGAPEVAKQYVSLGGYIGLGGLLENGAEAKWRQLLEAIPRERILVETDAPDMKAAAWPGERNEPANLLRVVRRLDQLLGADADGSMTGLAFLNKNARRLFARYGAPLNAEKI